MKLDALFNTFLSSDYLRPALRMPSNFGSHTVATDAHSFIEINNELLENNYPMHPQYPNIYAAIEVSKAKKGYKDISIPLDIEAIRTILDAIPKSNFYVNCDDCDDDECFGRCKDRKDKVVDYVNWRWDNFIAINECVFTCLNIEKLLLVADTLKQTVMWTGKHNDNGINVFHCGVVRFGLLSHRYSMFEMYEIPIVDEFHLKKRKKNSVL